MLGKRSSSCILSFRPCLVHEMFPVVQAPRVDRGGGGVDDVRNLSSACCISHSLLNEVWALARRCANY